MEVHDGRDADPGRRSAVIRALAVGVVLALAGLGPAAPAAADTVTSDNWAGYAVHGPGLRFASASGSWTEPRPACTPGRAAYSAVWVGIGGFSLRSSAVDQVGTVADCTSAGRPVTRAWLELVPEPARRLSLAIRPGDRLHASITVRGDRVRVSFQDLSRGESLRRTVRASRVDASSAEWIVEAPSSCSAGGECRTLALADFGLATIAGARAATADGRWGTIADPAWRRTRLTLVAPATAAAASLLAPRGDGFTVAYAGRPGVARSVRRTAGA